MSNYNRYKKAGYETREDYLNNLAVRYNINPMIISGLAEILGDEEDFDRLISAIEDMNDLISADRSCISCENRHEDWLRIGLNSFITF